MNKSIILIFAFLFFLSGCSQIIYDKSIFINDNLSLENRTYSSNKINELISNIEINNSSSINVTNIYNTINETIYNVINETQYNTINNTINNTITQYIQKTALNPNNFVLAETDFLFPNAGAFNPFYGTAISSGTTGEITSTKNNIGIIWMRDSTTANGGYNIRTGVVGLGFYGNETGLFIFQKLGIRTTTTVRLGFWDTATVTAPVDGCYLDIVVNTLRGRCRSNNAQTITSTNITLSNTIFYRGYVYANNDASVITFELRSSDGLNTLLWNNTITTNIPRLSTARNFGFGALVTESTSDAGADILYLDYMGLYINRTLMR